MEQIKSTSPRSVSGRVESVNPKGVKVNGEWHNFSRFAENIQPPERGQSVSLTLDKSGFVREVIVEGGSAAAPKSGQRDQVISRLAILKAAAEFAAGRPEIKSGDVLRIAESWERWVGRDAGDDLEDAF